MALTHLLDTSVLTRVGRDPVRRRLDELFATTTPGRPTIADLELGYSARNGAEWDQIMASLRQVVEIDVEPHHLRRAGQVQRMLADHGLSGRKMPDLLVAACAEDRGLVVVHYDADFDHIATVTGQPVEWVVPAGSID